MTMTEHTIEHANGAPVDDIDAWLTAGSRPQGSVDVCLAGDVWDEHSQLVELATAEGLRIAEINDKDATSQTMADRLAVSKARERIEELRGQLEVLRVKMAAATKTFKLQAIEPSAYRKMQIRHTPRDGDKTDQAYGVNVDTFYPALVEACTLEPKLTTEQWSTLRSRLSPKQWDDLWGTAHALNRRELHIPKSPTPSEPTASSDAE